MYKQGLNLLGIQGGEGRRFFWGGEEGWGYHSVVPTAVICMKSVLGASRANPKSLCWYY